MFVQCTVNTGSLQSSEETLAEARQAADGLEGRLFESSRRAQEAEAAWEVEREILSQTNESAQVREGRAACTHQGLRSPLFFSWIVRGKHACL